MINRTIKLRNSTSKDIEDIFFKDGINVDKIWHDVSDNLEADDDGNIRHGVKGSVCGNILGNVKGSW